MSDVQVKRCEGENDKVKYCVLLCGDDVDHNVKAASGALAMLTSASNKVCKKVFESKQWNDCLLNLLASTMLRFASKVVSLYRAWWPATRTPRRRCGDADHGDVAGPGG